MTLFGLDAAAALPVIFAGLLGLSILLYVILDGFDLGVGILLPLAKPSEQDRMVASIGPFWDANETWLVMGIGILLVAFPVAHGVILTALYLPVAVMLVGLILRGVAFEFRMKAPSVRKPLWTNLFVAGSVVTALSQGYMLGLYIMGLERTLPHVLFGLATAACVAAGYAFIGATWIILKGEDGLQRKAVTWARVGLVGAAAGLGLVSLATPLVSARIFNKWFAMPEFILLAPLPLLSGILLAVVWVALRQLDRKALEWDWVPFAAAIGLFAIAFIGLAYSFYPYIVPEKLTIYDSASAPESLLIILVGVLFVMPVILGYTALAYYIFRGKATELRYD
jgi:cytochrome d ubiquinol oxidase subunit II